MVDRPDWYRLFQPCHGPKPFELSSYPLQQSLCCGVSPQKRVLWTAYGDLEAIFRTRGRHAQAASLLARIALVVACDGGLRGEAWRFNNTMVIRAPYDGLSNPITILLQFLKFWVQLKNLLPVVKIEEVVRASYWSNT